MSNPSASAPSDSPLPSDAAVYDRATHWALAELDAQVKEILFGVESATPAQEDGTAAVATVKLLDGEWLQLRLDMDGVHAGEDSFDCVNSLLLNKSPQFAAAFNRSLAQQLAAVVAEREEADRRAEEEL